MPCEDNKRHTHLTGRGPLARSRFILPTAVLAAGLTGAASAQSFFGFSHQYLGGAKLTTGPAGELVIGNLGSVGKDGVEIDFGPAPSFRLALDVGPAGSLAAGSKTVIYAPLEGFGHDECIEICETGGGSAAVAYMTNDPGITCVTVTLLLDGAVVGQREFPRPFPAALVTGSIGSDPVSGAPLTFEHLTTPGHKIVDTITLDSAWQVHLLGDPSPVDADTVRLEPNGVALDGLPPGEPVRLQLANSNDVRIYSESLLLHGEDLDNDGLSDPRACSALGAAHIAAVCGPDICAGCPECCDPPLGDPLNSVCGVSVSNLGSSGEDGIIFTCPNPNPRWDDDITCEMSPIVLDQDDEALRFEATGRLSGTPPGSDQSLGYCELRNNLALGAIDILADFSDQGSQEVTVEVHSNGVFQGSVVFPNGSGGSVGLLSSVAGLPFGWNKCGKLGGTTSCIVACTDEQFRYVGGGQVLQGNDLRVLATGAAAPVEEISSYSIRCTNVEDFVCAIAPDDDDPQVVIASGMRHTAVGEAQLDVDPGDGTLTISNIGPSGLDGVSIDLGEAQGADNHGHDFTLDSFFDIAYRVEFSGGDSSTTHVQTTSPGQHVMTMTDSWPADQTVTLLDEDNEIIASFLYSDGDPLTITGDGGQVHITRYVDKATPELFLPLVPGEPVGGINVSLEQIPGGAAGSGVTVTHPTAGGFCCVRKVTLLKRNAGPSGPAHTATITAAVAGGSPPASVNMGHTGVVQFDRCHVALGQARITGEDCDDGDSSTDDGSITISNLGSSGLDGVSVDLSGFIDCDDDGDNIPDLELAGSFACRLLQEEGVSFSSCLSSSYETPAGSVSSHAVCVQDDGTGTGGRVLNVEELALLAPNLIRVRALDSNGQVVAEASGMSPGDLAQMSNFNYTKIIWTYHEQESGQFTASAAVPVKSPVWANLHNDRNDANPAELLDLASVTDVVYTLSAAQDETVTLPGGMPVQARSLVIAIRRVDGSPGTIRQLVSADITSAAPAGFGVSEEGVKRLAPACHADCAPINPDGTQGNDVVNIDDLFGVINAIATQDHRCDVAPDNGDGTSGNLTVNFDDIIKVINDFGPCP